MATKPAPQTEPPTSPWPHRWALALAFATFPLIWVGGLVTSYDAGMAVPDWPGTYGYNLFLYPWKTWIFGPFDLFIEHGHRLLGAFVGFLSIGMVVAVLRGDRRPWMKRAAIAGLVMVIGQGLLGGMRVLANDRVLAMVHGCFGPAFFAYTVFLCVATSRLWHASAANVTSKDAPRMQRLAVITAGLAYGQILIGAQLRHVSVLATAGIFRAFVYFHLLIAAALLVHLTLLVWRSRRFSNASFLKRPAWILLALGIAQVGLGGATWVLKYGWPGGLAEQSFSAGHLVVANGYAPAWIATAHVAVGSLILAVSVLVAARSCRLLRADTVVLGSAPLLMEMVK